jgi:hypothetical protein
MALTVLARDVKLPPHPTQQLRVLDRAHGGSDWLVRAAPRFYLETEITFSVRLTADASAWVDEGP